jgi:alpha-L-fucosidase
MPPRIPRPEPDSASNPFQPNWESLSQYQCPEWFRDAKFGIWAHWSSQCVPEQGDWYARNMYIQGEAHYKYHVEHYGHPSKFGFMEIDNLWKAEHWNPEKLMVLYKQAGAKYFVALANHHDNLDTYNSKYHAWNSVNVGPKKDIVGIWRKAALKNGLRFGVSNHAAHAWHWFQPAYGYDGEGPLAGVRYDAAMLTKADGKGKWWEGLDPQELYTGPNIKIPDGITGAKAVADWHQQNNRPWDENPPAMNPAFAEKWYLRCKDLIDKYRPSLIYFDDTELPLGQAGLDIAAYYYNANRKWAGGKLEAVVNAKQMKPDHCAALVEDIERGTSDKILPLPWQTCTCIGSWHYDRDIAEKNKYKTACQVVQMLVDIVSKNGNLLLSVPMRGDGTIDEHETAFLKDMAEWMKVNSECIFNTRPWSIYGEGPAMAEKTEAGDFGGVKDVRDKPYTAEDIRFTQSKDGKTLYVIFLAWQGDGKILIRSLAASAGKVTDVSLLGHKGRLSWKQTEIGLEARLPSKAPCQYAYCLKIANGLFAPSDLIKHGM